MHCSTLSVCIAFHILFANKHVHWSNDAWTVCLDHAKLAKTPWPKSNDSLSLKRNIEGHCSGHFLHPDYLLHTIGCSS